VVLMVMVSRHSPTRMSLPASPMWWDGDGGSRAGRALVSMKRSDDIRRRRKNASSAPTRLSPSTAETDR